MQQNAYLLAKIGADTAESEQHFAEILPIGRRVADRCPSGCGPTPLEDVRARGGSSVVKKATVGRVCLWVRGEGG